MKTQHADRGEQTDVIDKSIDRYGLITARALSAIRPDLYPNSATAKESLLRKTRQGHIRKATLYRDHYYYFRDGDLYTETAKTRAYAMLSLCVSRSRNRTRLTRDEFKQYFPDLCRTGLPANYYVDLTAENPVLGFVRIDMGGHGRWDRIVAKALDDARKHRLEPAYDRFIRRQALEIRIVTSLPQKADRISRALVDHPNHSGLPIQVSVIPELINLIAPVPNSTTQ